jgi:hypothetical protein
MRVKALLSASTASAIAQVRPARTIEDELLERTAEYEWWAITYGYTPGQVDDLPMWYRTRASTARSIRVEIDNDRERAERAKQR